MAPYRIRHASESQNPLSAAYPASWKADDDEGSDIDLVIQNKAERQKEIERAHELADEASPLKKFKYKAQLWFFSLDWGTQNCIHLVLAILTLLISTGFGGLVFAGLETDSGIAINTAYSKAMETIKSQLNQATGNDLSYWNNLVGVIGATDPSQIAVDTWGFTSYRAFLFAFTIITTIGYGEIAPKTIGGRLFLCAYAVLCVPIAGMALAKIATLFMDLAEWAIVGASPSFRQLFDVMDDKKRKLLDFNTAKDLIRDLQGGILDELSFRKAFEVASNMRSEPELNYWEFIRLYLMMDNPDMQRKRRYYRLYVSCVFVVAWLLVGMFSFNHFEQWGYVPSFYFSFVTLSTVGLGDYFPSTKPGADFHFFYCVFGLGLVAVFLSATGDILLEGEQSDLMRVQEEYVAKWEEKNKAFIDQLEATDENQMEIGKLMADARMQEHEPGSPRSFLAGGQHHPVGLAGMAMYSTFPEGEAVQDIYSKALMLDHHARDTLLAALCDKYKKLPQFVIDKLVKNGQLEHPLKVVDAKPKRPDHKTEFTHIVPPVRVHMPAYPTERVAPADALAEDEVPAFLPTYCQIYEEAPINISGVGRQGAPVPPIAGGPQPVDDPRRFVGQLPSVYAYDSARNNGPWSPPDRIPPPPPPPPAQSRGVGLRDEGTDSLEAATFAALGNTAVPTSVAGVPPTGAGRKNRRHNADSSDNRL